METCHHKQHRILKEITDKHLQIDSKEFKTIMLTLLTKVKDLKTDICNRGHRMLIQGVEIILHWLEATVLKIKIQMEEGLLKAK